MNDWIDQDEKVIWHPFTSTPVIGPKPRVIERAKGAFVFDDTGKRYFDATSSWWCNIHGHCDPRIVKALCDQADTMDQVLFAPHTHKPGIELASRLTKLLGPPLSRVFYSDDGSTAVETALKMSVQYWKNLGQGERKIFLSVDRGYHGDTLGTVAVGSVSEYHDAFQVFSTMSLKSTVPYCYRCPKKMTYPSCEIACLDEAKKIISEQGHRIAALVIEPLILGAGGMISYPKQYLDELTALCKSAGILVIFDEVFTGFGRTGTLFALDQVIEKPDIVCLSKGLTAGVLPLGVTVSTEKIFMAFQGDPAKAFYHGHTFTGNPIAISVAIESLKIFEEDQVLERNQTLMDVLRSEAERFRELPLVGDVRHLGMIWAMELVLDRVEKTVPEPSNDLGWKIADAMWDEGFWIRPLANMIYVIAPYCATPHDLKACFSMLYFQVQTLGSEISKRKS